VFFSAGPRPHHHHALRANCKTATLVIVDTYAFVHMVSPKDITFHLPFSHPLYVAGDGRSDSGCTD